MDLEVGDDHLFMGYCPRVTELLFSDSLLSFDLIVYYWLTALHLISSLGLQQWTQTQSYFSPELVIPRYE